jgi:dUTP pyrophosphatase
MAIKLAVKRLGGEGGLALPAYQTSGAAGLDLVADRFVVGDGPAAAACDLAPGGRVLVLTGIAVAIPAGHAGLVCPRSGLALRRGLTVLNAPGVIDSDFRGELGALIVNLGQAPQRLERGMRAAQLVIVPVAAASVEEVTELPDTARGAGGFGSTGA